MDWIRKGRRILFLWVLAAAAGAAGLGQRALATCGPFTDVAADSFCPFVLEVFTMAITTGTTPTTYDPAANVSRLQMAAFLSRTVDGVLKRGSRRAAMNLFYTPQNELALGVTTVGSSALFPASDGQDIWVSHGGGAVSRVRAGDGRLLETWTGATSPGPPLVAAGRIFVAGGTSPGKLYRIDPTQPAGDVTTVASNLGNGAVGITFDGSRIWTANVEGPSISIVTPAAAIPWPVSTVSPGLMSPVLLLFDGSNVWATDQLGGFIAKLDGFGTVLQTVTVGTTPQLPVFDGTNIWVPNYGSNSVTVLRASTGAVLSTLTGNSLSNPFSAAFDGQRVVVTNRSGFGVSLWKAADLTPLGFFSTGMAGQPVSACSDGVNFWLTRGPNLLLRF